MIDQQLNDINTGTKAGQKGLLTIEALKKADNTVQLRYTDIPDVATLIELCQVLQMPYNNMAATVVISQRLPQFMMLETPGLEFQATDVFQTHRVRCTGKKSFQITCMPNEWIWIQVGRSDMYGDLCGYAVIRLLGLYKIRNFQDGVVSWLAIVQVRGLMNSGRCHEFSRYIRVQKWTMVRDVIIIEIAVMVGQAHMVHYGNGQ
ncbi:hypothetical protein HOY82DRAFT_577677 [Tuber indicum]|nr:hypothetical protein HOY82DRAFT_577677 [Tuber indicum]